MKTSRNDPTSSDPYSLSRIKAIGQVRQQQLQELLDVTTLRSLAIASAAAIVEVLRDTDDSITEATVADWIAEAQKILSSVAQQQVEVDAKLPGQTVSEFSADHSEERKSIEREGDLPPPSPEEWQTRASILLELQVQTDGDPSVHRWRLLNPASDQSDNCQILSDQATHSLRDWLQHVGHVLFHPDENNPLQDWLLHQVPQVSEIIPQRHEPDSSLTGQVYGVLLLQPPDITMPIVAIGENAGFPGSLQANQLFQVRVDLVLPELGQWPLPAGASYSLEIFAKSLGYPNKAIFSIGKSRNNQLIRGQTQYKIEIGAAALSSGLYRLEILVTFQGLDIPLIIYEISRLQVI